MKKNQPSPPRLGMPNPVGITELTSENGDLAARIFANGIGLLSSAFTARLTRLNRYGDVVDLGSDFRTRIQALHLLLDVTLRGRTVLPPPEPRTGILYEELLELQKGLREPKAPEPERKPAILMNPAPKPVNISDLTAAHATAINELFTMGLESIESVCTARRTTLNRDGDLVDLGPDHVSVLAGMNLLLDLFVKGRQPLTTYP